MFLELITLAVASAAAGFVDAVVGGGGLIQVPALFSAFPGVAPATLFGTNKGGSIWGTAAAATGYLRRVRPPARVLLPATAAAFIGSLIGAWAVTLVQPGPLRKALPFILAAVLAYMLVRKDLGHTHTPRPHGRAATALALCGGGMIGLYDGFFGPGTGSFLVLLFVRGFGFDFLHASAAAKVVNVATNFAALLLFASSGHVVWPWAALLAVCNVTGSFAGTRVAMRRGTGFVRSMFIVVVAALIAKTAWDAFGGGAH